MASGIVLPWKRPVVQVASLVLIDGGRLLERKRFACQASMAVGAVTANLIA